MDELGFDTTALVRLAVALVLGAAIGFEREANDQPAGLRTHISVALGAALFGVISTLGFEEFVAERHTTNVQIDVTRVASQVVVGIGFLGAGVIFRHGASVRNLTTAASLWVTAAIGLAVGVGDLVVATIATAGLLLSLVVLRKPRSWIRNRITRRYGEVVLGLAPDADPQEVLAAARALEGVTVVRSTRERSAGVTRLRLRVRVDPPLGPSERLSALGDHPGVEELHPAEDLATLED